VGLLFGGEGSNNGDAGHSPLSSSWSAVMAEDAQVPTEDERITFSIAPLLNILLIVSWLGQSCSYVQIANSLNVLTDPIFGCIMSLDDGTDGQGIFDFAIIRREAVTSCSSCSIRYHKA